MERVSPRRRRGPDGRYLHRDAVIRWDGQVRVIHHWDPADDDPDEGGRRLTLPRLLLLAAAGLVAWGLLFWVGYQLWPVIP